MKKFLFLALSLAFMCLTAHAKDDVGVSYTTVSAQIVQPDIIAPAMPEMVVIQYQLFDLQEAPAILFECADEFPYQMASQVFMFANIETYRKKFMPPNNGNSSKRCRRLNHYCNYNYNYRH